MKIGHFGAITFYVRKKCDHSPTPSFYNFTERSLEMRGGIREYKNASGTYFISVIFPFGAAVLFKDPVWVGVGR